MAAPDAARRYDEYWRVRDVEPARARSEGRALLALELLRTLPDLSPGTDRRPRLLELGCGPGWALEKFAAAGYEARGVEISPVAVEAARSRGLEVEEKNIEGGLPGGEWEVLAFLEVLEHLVNPLSVLRDAKSLLAAGGCMVVSLPNEFHLLRRLAVLFGRARFGGHDDPHLHHFDGHLARRLLMDAGQTILGRRSDSLVPARRPFLKCLSRPWASLFPGLFALSNVYLLRPAEN